MPNDLNDREVQERLRELEVEYALLKQKLEAIEKSNSSITEGINRVLWIIGGGFVASVVTWIAGGGLGR